MDSHFIFECNVGKRRIRHTVCHTLKLIDEFLNRLKIDGRLYAIQLQNGSMSDPPLSDIEFKNKIVWV